MAVKELVGKADNPPQKFTVIKLKPVAESLKAAG